LSRPSWLGRLCRPSSVKTSNRALDIEDILSREVAASFDLVDTEAAAVAAAIARRPDIITVDVVLKSGLGADAVTAILRRYGAIPGIFITSTPDVCCPDALTRVVRKPVSVRACSHPYDQA